jgi:hypothetical protein
VSDGSNLEIEALYAFLRKRAHPDGKPSSEHAWFEEVMKRLNVARDRADVHELRRIAQELERNDPTLRQDVPRQPPGPAASSRQTASFMNQILDLNAQISATAAQLTSLIDASESLRARFDEQLTTLLRRTHAQCNSKRSNYDSAETLTVGKHLASDWTILQRAVQTWTEADRARDLQNRVEALLGKLRSEQLIIIDELHRLSASPEGCLGVRWGIRDYGHPIKTLRFGGQPEGVWLERLWGYQEIVRGGSPVPPYNGDQLPTLPEQLRLLANELNKATNIRMRLAACRILRSS